MDYNTPLDVWLLVKENLKDPKRPTKNIHLSIIIASQIRSFGGVDITPSQYREITGRSLYPSSPKKIQGVTQTLTKTGVNMTRKSRYIKVPEWFLRIPLKNTFELKVAHYKVSINGMNSSRYKFEVFCSQYNVTPTRKNKWKFNKILTKNVSRDTI